MSEHLLLASHYAAEPDLEDIHGCLPTHLQGPRTSVPLAHHEWTVRSSWLTSNPPRLIVDTSTEFDGATGLYKKPDLSAFAEPVHYMHERDANHYRPWTGKYVALRLSTHDDELHQHVLTEGACRAKLEHISRMSSDFSLKACTEVAHALNLPLASFPSLLTNIPTNNPPCILLNTDLIMQFMHTSSVVKVDRWRLPSAMTANYVAAVRHSANIIPDLARNPSSTEFQREVTK